jgi:small-conductance mechanosensitive channel
MSAQKPDQKPEPKPASRPGTKPPAQTRRNAVAATTATGAKFPIFPIFLFAVIAALIFSEGRGWLDTPREWLDRDAFDYNLGRFHFDLIDILENLFAATTVFLLAWAIGKIVERRIAKSRAYAPATKTHLIGIVYAALFFLAAIFALAALALTVPLFEFLGWALGIGFGLALARPLAQIVGGIVLLADQSLRLGDTISLPEGPSGQLRRFALRGAWLAEESGDAVFLPYDRLLEKRFVNSSLSFGKPEITLQIAAPAQADPRIAIATIVQTAQTFPGIAAETAQCLLTGFDAQSQTLLLTAQLTDAAADKRPLAAGLRLEILRALQAGGLSFAARAHV